MTSVDADLRSGRRLETGRRSESIIYLYIDCSQYSITVEKSQNTLHSHSVVPQAFVLVKI